MDVVLKESELSKLKERNRWLHDQLQSTVNVIAEKNTELETVSIESAAIYRLI